MHPDIPTEGRIPLLDITIPIHWDNHAILMFAVWFVVVPASVMFLRFGKIAPRLLPVAGLRAFDALSRELVER